MFWRGRFNAFIRLLFWGGLIAVGLAFWKDGSPGQFWDGVGVMGLASVIGTFALRIVAWAIDTILTVFGFPLFYDIQVDENLL